jgi:hypothetical protein
MNLVALQRIEDVGTIAEGQVFVADGPLAGQLIASGFAAVEGTRIVWPKLDWSGSTVVIIASGPSLTKEDCELVKAWRDPFGEPHEVRVMQQEKTKRRVIVINTSFQRALWADVLYACDTRWWDHYWREAHEDFVGHFWTQDEPAAIKHKLNYVRSESGQGLNRKPGTINQGANGGYQAVSLAYLAGAVKIILLGFDMSDWGKREGHWHPDHPGRLHSFPQYAVWMINFGRLAKDLRSVGVPVVNASRRTAMTCFPKVRLEEALQ